MVFGTLRDPALVVRALGYFADVDKEPMPAMISPVTWDQAKRDLTRSLERLNLEHALRTRCLSMGPDR